MCTTRQRRHYIVAITEKRFTILSCHYEYVHRHSYNPIARGTDSLKTEKTSSEENIRKYYVYGVVIITMFFRHSADDQATRLSSSPAADDDTPSHPREKVAGLRASFFHLLSPIVVLWTADVRKKKKKRRERLA